MHSRQFYVDYQTNKIWERLSIDNPMLIRYNPPKIVLCNRLTRTAGKCYQTENLIHMANKFFINNAHEMMTTILPHEIIHQADYNLFGDSEKTCGHGVHWQMLMVQYGLKPDPYHYMEL
jgi:predicted SprT family Zn-dependent metalloprotease